MKSLFITISLFFFTYLIVFGQSNLPMIRANSRNVDVRDGLHFRKGFWYIMPEIKPDIYHVELPQKNNTVTLYSDLDSISFEIKAGEKQDFIILLNGKDTCLTRISSEKKPSSVFLNSSKSSKKDTIMFYMRKNRIYFEGIINQKEKAIIQFDLGAGSGCIRRNALSNETISFDEKGYLTNSDGQNLVKISSKNKVQFSNLEFDNVTFFETRNMKRWEDIIVGNNLFLNNVVEINYNSNQIILHDDLPDLNTHWVKLDMILDNGICPIIKATLEIKGKKCHDWFLFDTGNTGNALIPKSMYERHGIYQKASRFPKIHGRKIAKSNILIGKNHSKNKLIIFDQNHTGEFGLLGNQLLRNFNVILDNRNGFLYLRLNN